MAKTPADDGDRVADVGPKLEAKDDGNAGLDVRQDGTSDTAVETKGLIARFADCPEHAFGGEEIRSGGQRGRFVRSRWGGKTRDIRDGYPVVPVPRVHVAHAGPDGDLGTSADAGILLEIRGTGHLEVDAKQIGLEWGTACHRGLHVLAAADRGLQDRPANGGSWQGTNNAKPAIAVACDLPELKKLLF